MEKVGGYPRAGGRFHFEKDWKNWKIFKKIGNHFFAVPFLLLL